MLLTTATAAETWTAIGTLALAAVTFISLLFGWRALKDGQKQAQRNQEQLEQGEQAISQGQERLTQLGTVISQGQEGLDQARQSIDLAREQLEKSQLAVDLSRKEIEEAHRPIVIPVGDRHTPEANSQELQSNSLPYVPDDGVLCIPVENVGAGPALNLRASVVLTAASPEDRTHAANLRGLHLAAGGRAVIEITNLLNVSDDSLFTLQLFFEDVASKMWETRAGYLPSLGYTELTIETVSAARRGLLIKQNFVLE